MEDKGEKIIYLARELLEANDFEEPVKKKTMSVTMTFRSLCFTTILAAASGNLISTYVSEQSRPLNRYERVELQALVFYTAKLKGMTEDAVREQVGKEVGVAQFDDLTAKEFASARRYLQEKAQ